MPRELENNLDQTQPESLKIPKNRLTEIHANGLRPNGLPKRNLDSTLQKRSEAIEEVWNKPPQD